MSIVANFCKATGGEIKKYNENHDDKGLFSSGGGGGNLPPANQNGHDLLTHLGGFDHLYTKQDEQGKPYSQYEHPDTKAHVLVRQDGSYVVGNHDMSNIKQDTDWSKIGIHLKEMGALPDK